MGDVPSPKDNSTVAMGIPKPTQPLHTKENKGVSEWGSCCKKDTIMLISTSKLENKSNKQSMRITLWNFWRMVRIERIRIVVCEPKMMSTCLFNLWNY